MTAVATLTFTAFTKVKHKNVLSHSFPLSMGHILVDRKNFGSKFNTNDNSPNSFLKEGSDIAPQFSTLLAK